MSDPQSTKSLVEVTTTATGKIIGTYIKCPIVYNTYTAGGNYETMTVTSLEVKDSKQLRLPF